jgi:hypothetical protein
MLYKHPTNPDMVERETFGGLSIQSGVPSLIAENLCSAATTSVTANVPKAPKLNIVRNGEARILFVYYVLQDAYGQNGSLRQVKKTQGSRRKFFGRYSAGTSRALENMWRRARRPAKVASAAARSRVNGSSAQRPRPPLQPQMICDTTFLSDLLRERLDGHPRRVGVSCGPSTAAVPYDGNISRRNRGDVRRTQRGKAVIVTLPATSAHPPRLQLPPQQLIESLS